MKNDDVSVARFTKTVNMTLLCQYFRSPQLVRQCF